MTLLLLYVALALGVSFLCSIMEAVLLSVTPGYVKARLREGGRTAVRLEQFKQNIDRPLSAILTLNTIAHTVGAAGAGAQAAAVFGDVWLGVASGVLTLLILVVSEIIPKTLGAVYWRSLVSPVVSLLTLLVVALNFVLTLTAHPYGGENKAGLQRLEYVLLGCLCLTLWAGSVFDSHPRCEAGDGTAATLGWCEFLSVSIAIIDIVVILFIALFFLRLKGAATFLDKCVGETRRRSHQAALVMTRSFRGNLPGTHSQTGIRRRTVAIVGSTGGGAANSQVAARPWV